MKGKDNMSHKTLFLQQSYEDCTRQYMELLEKQKMPLWDYVILTASNESQAQSYRMQIQYRLDHGMLPKSIHYAVLPDPDGKRVGRRRYIKCAALQTSGCRKF